MKKYRVCLKWEESYEIDVEAENETDAESKALEGMENGECDLIDTVYSDCQINTIN